MSQTPTHHIQSPDNGFQRAEGIENASSLFVTLLAVAASAGLFLTSDHVLLEIIFGSVADAYLQVTTFVAGTFLLIYGAEKFFKVDAVAALRRDTAWQIPIAAALGAMPGCGGAVIVVTQFVTGRLSFGSVVATPAARGEWSTEATRDATSSVSALAPSEWHVPHMRTLHVPHTHTTRLLAVRLRWLK